jgi:hypothetical protein
MKKNNFNLGIGILGITLIITSILAGFFNQAFNIPSQYLIDEKYVFITLGCCLSWLVMHTNDLKDKKEIIQK